MATRMEVYGRVSHVNYKNSVTLVTLECSKNNTAYTFELDHSTRVRVGDFLFFVVKDSELDFKSYYHEPHNRTSHLAWKHSLLAGIRNVHNLGPDDVIGPLFNLNVLLSSIFEEKLNIVNSKNDLKKIKQDLALSLKRINELLDER